MNFLPDYKPKVSVVMPTFNRSDLLHQSLPSILSQDFKDFELIIVDDGSTDDTEKYVRSLKDPRIIFIQEANRGEYAATNLGLRAAAGQYLTWIHSDDVWPEGTLSKRVKTLDEHPEADFTHGDIQNLDGEGVLGPVLEAFDGSAIDAYHDYMIPRERAHHPFLVHHTTIMMRRRLLEKTGHWDATMPYAGDFEWLLRALRVATMVKTPGILYLYRIHNQSRSLTDPKHLDVREVREFIFDRYRQLDQVEGLKQ